MDEILEVTARTASLCTSLLFIVAVRHKVSVLLAGKAKTEPLIEVSEYRVAHAGTLLLVVAAIELLIAAALIALPLVGFISAGILTGVYAFQLRRLPSDQPCNCFGAMFTVRSRRVAIGRNVVIANVSILLAAFYAAGLTVGTIQGAVVDASVLVATAVASVEGFRRLFSPADVVSV